MTLRSLLTVIASSLVLLACNGFGSHSKSYAQERPLPIQRFDKDLLQLVEANDSTLFPDFVKKYPGMITILGKAVLNMQTPHTPGFYHKLVNYYSEPTLKKLYQESVSRYDTVDVIAKELGESFAYLHDQFPMMQIPAVYMHVSGFNQNVLVGDSLLSISIDKYMGEDYPLYQDFFYPYQRHRMTNAMVVPDYLSGWLMAEFPFSGKDNVLLDRMIYEGKLKYIISHALPNVTPTNLMGYNKEEWKWCEDHEQQIWKTIIERKNLYTPDIGTTGQYFEPAPSTFLSDQAPGLIGTWMGWRIVDKYMKESKNTLLQLIHNEDAQAILTASQYK